MKFKLLLLCVAMVAALSGSMFLLTACGGPTFDTTTVTVKNTVATYDGQAHSIEIEGEIPDWVTTSVVYKQSGVDEAVTPIDAGTYTATVSFKNEKAESLGEDQTATLTINKANFSNISVTVNATAKVTGVDGTQTQVAKYDPDDDEYYYELDETVEERKIAFPTIIADGNVYTISEDNLTFYSAIQEDETFNSEDVVIEKDLLQCDLEASGGGIDDGEVPDVVYIQYTISDKNHNPYTDYIIVRVTRITHEIKTYEDLVAMREFIVETSENMARPGDYNTLRRHRWVLRNDIDCGGEVWTPIGRTYYSDQNAEQKYYDCPFIGEFDGNGYTISNFKITNESFEGCLDATNGINAAFFGYTASARIHDVNFDRETIEINTTGYNWNGGNPVYAAFVVGRVGSEHSGTNIYNVKVTNSKINVNAYKIMAGGIIAYEQTNAGEKNIRRENLDVENVEIYAINASEQNQRIVTGGIVGDSRAVDTITYKNCDVKNAKLGFDYAAYTAATENKDKLITKDAYDQYVAVLLGYAKNAKVAFEDCTAANYLLTTAIEVETIGYYGKFEGNSEITFENCTHANDPTWNGGVSGVYSKTGATQGATWNGDAAAA